MQPDLRLVDTTHCDLQVSNQNPEIYASSDFKIISTSLFSPLSSMRLSAYAYIEGTGWSKYCFLQYILK